MNAHRLAVVAGVFLAALSVVAPVSAQDDPPKTGKIHEVEQQADGSDDSGGLALLRLLWRAGRFLAVHAPGFDSTLERGQGYLAYPYQDPRALEHFVLSDVVTHKSFLNGTMWYYSDIGSTLRGVHVALDGAMDIANLSFEYDYFREPTLSGTDHLQLVRLGVGGLPRLSHAAFLRTGLALRSMILDDGRVALGPEAELGIQVFPLRPFSFDGTFRMAGLTGAGAAFFGTALIDASAGAGVLVGRVEVRAGFRWLVIGQATPLAGPILGARIWF